MIVAHGVEELADRERTVAIGSFDGVHRGHVLVIDTARDVGGALTAMTFWPHPRLVLGNRVELLSTLERRLELLEAAGIDETLVVAFTPSVAALTPEEFADSMLRRIGANVIVVGENFRFGRAAAGKPSTLERLGFTGNTAPSNAPPIRLRITVRPTLSGLSVAPTTATDRGANSVWRLERGSASGSLAGSKRSVLAS